MNDAQILNKNTINSLQEILEDGIFDIMSDYKTQTENFIIELKVAQENNDIEKIIHIAHTIKGSSGSLGLEKILGLTHNLETTLREGKDIDLPKTISEICDAFDQTITELIANNYLT